MRDYCDKCGRPLFGMHTFSAFVNLDAQDAAYCYIVHDYYGCDTGCCGHVFYLADKDGRILHSRFEFVHPDCKHHDQWTKDILGQAYPNIAIRLDLCEVVDD